MTLAASEKRRQAAEAERVRLFPEHRQRRPEMPTKRKPNGREARA